MFKRQQAEWPASAGPGAAPQTQRSETVAAVMQKENPPQAETFKAPEPQSQAQVSRPQKKREMVERKSPELVQFDSPGVFVSGVLRDVGIVDVRERDKQGNLTGKISKVAQITFFNEDEQRPYKILGTYDLNAKISRADVGKYCEVTYLGDDKDVGRNGNQMKKFKVEFEADGKKFSDGSTITDDDLPF